MTKTVALCLGSALNVWDDFGGALALLSARHRVLVLACNFTGLVFRGHLDAWVSLHGDLMPGWMAKRRAYGLPDASVVMVCDDYPPPGTQNVPQRWPGSSGLYMPQVALDVLQADCALLCGVPLTYDGGHIHHGGAWDKPERYYDGFRRAKADGYGPRIRSMSGWTREYLGAPDAAWLA